MGGNSALSLFNLISISSTLELSCDSIITPESTTATTLSISSILEKTLEDKTNNEINIKKVFLKIT